ncbi:hypothetical protein ACIBH1_10475 [Nonomuraea sp. NPDC050663]|uniref:hypothetical protein n=1 Tax=Nonomuraea sp. NPDC050663 TaxID=3364370 RepID=UPI00378878FC
MREIETIEEIWSYHCLRCLHIWQDAFQAHHCGESVAWHHNGQASMPPWSEATNCPRCAALQVKVLPRSGRPSVPRQERTERP